MKNIKLFKESIKGELTVVISEKNIKNKVLDEKMIVKKAKRLLKKNSLKDVVKILFDNEKINKKDLSNLFRYKKL